MHRRYKNTTSAAPRRVAGEIPPPGLWRADEKLTAFWELESLSAGVGSRSLN